MSDLVLDCVFHKWGQVDKTWFPENLNDFIHWCTEKLNSIPEEYRDSAKIRIRLGEHNEHGNFLSGSIAITYMRPKAGPVDRCSRGDQIEAIELLKKARQVIDDEREWSDGERAREMGALLERIDALLDLKGTGDDDHHRSD